MTCDGDVPGYRFTSDVTIVYDRGKAELKGVKFKLAISDAILTRSAVPISSAVAVVRNYDKKLLWTMAAKTTLEDLTVNSRSGSGERPGETSAASSTPAASILNEVLQQPVTFAKEFPHQEYHHAAWRFGRMDPQRGVARPSITPGYGIFVTTPGMLRAYALPPTESLKDMPLPTRFESIDLPEKAYVGLVLDVKHTYLFVSVLVHHPDERKAGWINILDLQKQVRPQERLSLRNLEPELVSGGPKC